MRRQPERNRGLGAPFDADRSATAGLVETKGSRPSNGLTRALGGFGRGETGTSAIEFAMVAPVLIMILVGVLCYGLYFGAASSVQQLAADAARASVAGLSDAERVDIARKHVAAQAKSYVLLDPTRASVTAASLSGNADMFQVSVSYDASKLALWTFEKLIPLPSKTIVRSSVIQRGGY